jgi:hypothetical protein
MRLLTSTQPCVRIYPIPFPQIAGYEYTIAFADAFLEAISWMIQWMGTVMLLEILGEPWFFANMSSINAGMGEISFLQMFYWVREMECNSN